MEESPREIWECVAVEKNDSKTIVGLRLRNKDQYIFVPVDDIIHSNKPMDVIPDLEYVKYKFEKEWEEGMLKVVPYYRVGMKFVIEHKMVWALTHDLYIESIT